MHVSILAGSLLTPSAYSEHKEHVAALDIHLCGIGVAERSPACDTKPRSICQRFELFAQDVQPALQETCLQCSLM